MHTYNVTNIGRNPYFETECDVFNCSHLSVGINHPCYECVCVCVCAWCVDARVCFSIRGDRHFQLSKQIQKQEEKGPPAQPSRINLHLTSFLI